MRIRSWPGGRECSGWLIAAQLTLMAGCVGSGTVGTDTDGSAGGAAAGEHPAAGFPKPRRDPPRAAWHTSVVEPQAGGSSALGLAVRPGRALLPPNESLVLPVAIEVRAQPRAIRRPPLDLSLVFDKSGSMKGEGKLAYTMQAARLLIENLSEQDTVSIVAYDTNVVVLDPQQPAVERLFLAHWTDEIEAGGDTNLSGGLLAGIAEVRRGRRPEALARVILLTDGLANRGVTDVDGLRSIARAAREEGITISTIGVGSKFDEGLLFALADAGGGSYAYVPEAEDIPGVVAGQIEGLLPVVCQNLRLSLQLSEEVELVDLIVAAGPDLAGPARPPTRSVPTTIDLHDLVPGESRTVILRFRLPALPGPGTLSVFRARIDYQLAGEAGRPAFQDQELLLAVAASREESEQSVDRTVMDTAWLADVFDLTYLALQSRDWELVDQAQRTIATYREDLEELANRGETGTLREHAALLAHYGEELERMVAEGTFHEHEGGGETYEETKKDLHYRRYLLLHHGVGEVEDSDHP